MDIKKLQRAIVDGLEDVKAQHIAVFNTEHLSSMFERVIIASGTSNRQTKALAASVRNSVKARGMPVMSTEDEDNGEWIIVDCGAAVAHIMQPAIREYYHLEEIWGGKNVRMKVGAVSTQLVKASEPAPVARKSPATKPARPAAAAPAPGRKSAAAPAKKAASPRPSGKTEADRKMANRTAAFKRVAAKSPASKSPAGRSPAAKSSAAKPAAVKPAARKTAAKTPARKAPAKTAARKAPTRAR